ncbi:MAG TPA: c-type cytochrome domain-containing protein, partial [Pirellulales bacterium]|nr:c-type cytochrome domain-containing protein [Pirellulales bacterium]
QIIAALTEVEGKPGNVRAKSKQIPNRTVPSGDPDRQQFVRKSAVRALTLMERSSDVFLETGFTKEANCVSCHHQSMTSVAANWANARGIPPNLPSLRKIVDATRRALEPEISKCYEGIVPNPNPGIENGYMLMLLDALGHPADAVTDALVWQMAASQKPDGSWPWAFSRPPLEHGHIKATALAVKSLRTYSLPSRKKEFAERIERAQSWLLGARAETPTELAFQLLGLGWAGAKPHSTRAFTDAILAAQRSDGGWATLANLESDAWMTGLNLVALHEAGGVKAGDPAYRRGVDFLLRTQFDDGSWWVRSRTLPALPHFDSQFPHGKDQFISAAGTGWATMALLLTLETTPQATSLRAQMAALPAIQAPSAVSPDQQATAKSTTAALSFKKDIQPILERSCMDCHGGETPKGSFNSETLAGLIKGGQSGNPAVISGRADTSPLIRFVRDKVEDLEMPPLAERPVYAPLTTDEIQKLSLWIDQGLPE